MIQQKIRMPRQNLKSRAFAAALLSIAFGAACAAAHAESGDDPTGVSRPDEPGESDSAGGGLLADIKAYYTAPLHWSEGEWVAFAGVLAAVGASHAFDSRVRTHFVHELGPSDVNDTKDLQDAIPTVAVFLGTWGYASLIDDSSGRRETWTMFEAAALSGVTAYALKYAVDREGPNQTSDPNAWHEGGGSFPSLHATVAFAVGTVLAESGNDEYRWLRRLLGYGLGLATDYQRLRHNAHWLSDVVAGSALGAASAGFSMNRNYSLNERVHLTLLPAPGGAVLSCRVNLP
jgi:membrane-associated phospholipid phosphatase